MKVLMFVCGFAALVGGAVVGCGPKQPYCKDISSGLCVNDSFDAGPQGMDMAGPGDAVIIGGDDTGP